MPVSLHPYNQSAILQCVKYAKSITGNIAKEIEKQIETNNVFLDKKSNIKTLVGAGN